MNIPQHLWYYDTKLMPDADAVAPVGRGGFVWLTNLARPSAAMLPFFEDGAILHRYRVIDANAIEAWLDIAPKIDQALVFEIELQPAASPANWFVSRSVVHIEYDPKGVRR